MLMVAIRGVPTARVRALVESTGMTLSRLVQDAVLVYEDRINASYEPGTCLAQWRAGAAADLS